MASALPAGSESPRLVPPSLHLSSQGSLEAPELQSVSMLAQSTLAASGEQGALSGSLAAAHVVAPLFPIAPGAAALPAGALVARPIDIQIYLELRPGLVSAARLTLPQQQQLNTLHAQIIALLRGAGVHQDITAINPAGMFYAYEEGGERKRGDLYDYCQRDPALLDLVSQYQALIDEVYPYRIQTRPMFAPGYKGNTHGGAALQRPNGMRQVPPPIAPTRRQGTEINLVSALQQNYQTQLTQKLAQKQSLLGRVAALPNDRRQRFEGHIQRLEREIAELKQSQRRVERFDLFAVQWALLYAPDDFADADQRRAAAERARQALEATLQNNHPRTPLSAEEKEYAADVGALLLTERLEYLTYCEKHKIAMKQVATDEEAAIRAIRGRHLAGYPFRTTWQAAVPAPAAAAAPHS